MIQSVPIKKEIIKTFLKNVNKPIAEISSALFKQLDKSFLRGERLLLDKSTRCTVLRRESDIYKVRLDNTNCVDAEFSKLERAEPISKNMLYGFLMENTSQTIFGRVLKLNVYNDIKKEPEKSTVQVRKPEKKLIKSITDYAPVVAKEKREVGRKYENRVDMFELFVFFTRFSDFVSLSTPIGDFEVFMREMESPRFRSLVVKELMRIIRHARHEESFDDLIVTSLKINHTMIESIRADDKFTEAEGVDWSADIIDKASWTSIVKNFVTYCSQVDSAALKLINVGIFKDDFTAIAKFLFDIVLHCTDFKTYFDKKIEKIRKFEKERYELCGKIRRVDAQLSEEERNKQKRLLTNRLVEIDRFLCNNRLKPCFGRFDGSNYFFVCEDIYFVNGPNVFYVEKTLRDDMLKSFKGNREASAIVIFCRNIVELENASK